MKDTSFSTRSSGRRQAGFLKYRFPKTARRRVDKLPGSDDRAKEIDDIVQRLQMMFDLSGD